MTRRTDVNTSECCFLPIANGPFDWLDLYDLELEYRFREASRV